MAEPVQQALMARLQDPSESVRWEASDALASAQVQGLRFCYGKHSLHQGRLISDFSATPFFSDRCVSNKPVRRPFALVPLEA